MKNLKKVLVLGSGALKIGEAGEFDYSGSQAMKALKEEGVKTVLINPNVATIQTSQFLAQEIYFLPITPYFVEQVIKKERPDGILLSFGGQTALNCGVALHRTGVFKKYRVKVLGTSIRGIILTEDRAKFAAHLRSIGLPIPASGAAITATQALAIAKKIGYPIMVRAAYTLGGQKSGVAHTPADLKKITEAALELSPQVLIEKYLRHYKEIEYEVVRDRAGNCVTVCNMENVDPMGIHTGDSIVVAPSQTLTNDEFHTLREASIKIVRSLGIVGECNVQYALNPKPKKGRLEYYVIEVNARLSRSSALASKATGYPLAYVACKLGLGKLLSDIPNQVTKVTQSFFEPALDYVVVKIPRWDLEKFKGAEERIGSAMKSVGEVMALGRTFEEALQKAIRMLYDKAMGLGGNGLNNQSLDALRYFLRNPTPRRLFAVAEGLAQGISVREIYHLTGIDPWFLYRIKNIVLAEQELALSQKINQEKLLSLKQLGVSDRRIAAILRKKEDEIRKLRKKYKIRPAVFQIDTLAGEVPAKTNYLYLTYNGFHYDVKPLGQKGVIVLGSGPYRIGSSVEFDWTCVHTAMALKKYGKKSIIINCNPETVSTDYDMSERLYFEELTLETISEIYDFEKSSNVIVSVGGQTPNNLAQDLARNRIPILGTKTRDIDRAEDRNKFSALLDKLGIAQPQWQSFTDMSAAEKFASRVSYPVLIRPSYVLSGSAMTVCYNQKDLAAFINKAALINSTHPVTVSKFISGAKELDFDAVSEKGKIQIAAISEHVEHAGVHSGDATIVYPPQKVYIATAHKITGIARKLAMSLRITGPFNIQFLVKDNQVYVIEINLRASRSFPFISKATGVNFAEVGVAAFFGKSHPIELVFTDYVMVKSPQFSFSRLQGADPVLRVEMASTGEVACFGENFKEALLKSIYSTGSFNNKKAALFSLGGTFNKRKLLEAVVMLSKKGYQIFATISTFKFFQSQRIPVSLVYKVYEKKKPSVLEIIQKKEVAFVVNLSERNNEPEEYFQKQVTDGYLIRRAAVDCHIPLFTDIELAKSFVKALVKYELEDLHIKPWTEYMAK